MLARVISPARSVWKAGSVVALGALGLVGCSLLSPNQEIEQRSTQGPSGQQMFNLRIMTESGREPTFDEKRQWDEQIELRISDYLRRHPEKANDLNVSTFKFLRQASVGMDQEQILILLGAPVAVSGDQDHMQQLARRYWPLIQGNATEVWIYQLGWNLFFAGQRLIDITQYVPRP
jgi:hypothetical protein